MRLGGIENSKYSLSPRSTKKIRINVLAPASRPVMGMPTSTEMMCEIFVSVLAMADFTKLEPSTFACWSWKKVLIGMNQPRIPMKVTCYGKFFCGAVHNR